MDDCYGMAFGVGGGSIDVDDCIAVNNTQGGREPSSQLQQELDALFGSGRHQEMACFAM